MNPPDADPSALLAPLLALHDAISADVVAACEHQDVTNLAEVAGQDAGDTIYAIDRVGEERLVHEMAAIARTEPLVLVAEGLSGGARILPDGAKEADCRWRVIVDPIDGTRGLMYQKRSGWVLTGVAPNRGTRTSLADITLAVQTEIPLIKQHLADQVWARRGRGATATRRNRLTGSRESLSLRPSASATIAHGFATVVRFFPGARDVLGAVDDEIARELLGRPEEGKAASFEDQYASTGGQLYELMAGRDRFVADLRPLVNAILKERGLPRALCCHPYDICTALIAEELGVEVTGPDGAGLDAPFDTTTDVAWVGYANAGMRAAVEPVVRSVLRKHRLLGAGPA